MATSGTYSFSVSRNDIVREALLNINKIDGIDPIEDVVMNDCVRKLNLLTKQWMGKTDFAPGLKVWTRKRGHMFLRATTGQYTAGPTGSGWTNSYVQTYSTATVAAAGTVIPVVSATGITAGDQLGIELNTGDLYWTTVTLVAGLNLTVSPALPSASLANNIVFTYTTVAQQPLMIETALLRDAQYNDTPLNIMQARDYDFLPNKVSPTNYGDPTAIYYENQLSYGYIYTDVAGADDVTKHVVVSYLEPVQDITNASDTPYYPAEWFRPLCWGLAKECAPMFNATWGPTHESNYKSALQIAQQKDPEVETRYFQCGE